MARKIHRALKFLWVEAIHKDDADQEEKIALVEQARNSPPILPMHAFLHPFLMARAYRQFQRYRGKSWIWPRIVSFVFLGILFIITFQGATDLLSRPDASVWEGAFFLVYVYIVLPLVVLFPHYLTTVDMRLAETCVWCHIIQRSHDGSIVAVLVTTAYRLPFLDPDRDDVVPWTQRTNSYWKPVFSEMVLETNRDVSQLYIPEIYDESVCKSRGSVTVPPSARRYVVKEVTRIGNVITKERGPLYPVAWPRAQTNRG